MGILDGETDFETGSEKRIEIWCSKTTRSQFKSMLAEVDPDLTYEEFLHVVLQLYHDQPRQFERALKRV